jgi:hypothetical protein
MVLFNVWLAQPDLKVEALPQGWTIAGQHIQINFLKSTAISMEALTIKLLLVQGSERNKLVGIVLL